MSTGITIDKHSFFDALRAFIDLRDVTETRILPNRVEVHRLTRDENGERVIGPEGDVVDTVTVYLLV